jgi:tetratricopeptide (TPR) repeat protein/photosystem II stability/assembly factor-like uncharacterized protein
MIGRIRLHRMLQRSAEVFTSAWTTSDRWLYRSSGRVRGRLHRMVRRSTEVVSSRWTTSEGWLHRLARVASSAAKLLAAVLVIILLVLVVRRRVMDFYPGIVRVKPFEVAKSLDESGFTGAALAERFREKLTEIESSVKDWNPRGGRKLATTPIQGGDPLGEVKVPGTDLSIDGLADLILTTLRRPPVVVTGRIVSTPAAMIATIKVADASDQPSQIRQVLTPLGCDGGCVDALVTQMAEAFYAQRIPCSLELYYYIGKRSESETELAARRCAQEDPVFAYYIWGLFEADRGNLHTAVNRLQRARDLAAREGSLRKTLEAIIFNDWGIVLTKVQDCPGAIKQYELAIRADPKGVWPYVNKGSAMAGIKGKRGAAAMYAKAIAVAYPDPAPPDVYTLWAHLLFDHGRFKEAAALLQPASDEAPLDTTILYDLAYSLDNAGRKEEALAAYERIIDLKPRELDGYRQAADLLRSCHRFKEAKEELHRALGFLDAEGQAKLSCELADLEQQLREKPEVLSSQLGTCESFVAAAGAGGGLLPGQSWTTAEPCHSAASRFQLVADPRRAGTVYTIAKESQDSIVSSLTTTTDWGATWSVTPAPTIGEIPGATIQRIALDSRHGVLFVLSSNGVIARSVDQGATWQLVGGPSLPSFRALDLAVAPGNAGTLYTLLSAKVPCPKHGFTATSCAQYRVFTSRNRGRNWLARGSWLLADPMGDDPAGQIWVDPFAASTVYAGVSVGARINSLRKSLDGGTTWRPLAVSPRVVTAVFDPVAPGTLYIAVAGDCQQLLKSTDAGGKWLPANGGDLPHGTDVTALAFAAGTLYSGTAGGQVFAMLDDARTWRDVTRGLLGVPILSLAADGQGTVYAGLDGGGLYALSVNKR